MDIARVLKNLDIQKVDGIYLDLGVSSYQLDTPERGFTYREENAPLDMRMDQRKDKTAAIIVNTYSEQELFRIIRDYGEDRFAKNIAKHIVKAREKGDCQYGYCGGCVFGSHFSFRGSFLSVRDTSLEI